MPVKNVTHDYPPTMLIHGTNDTDVPCELLLMLIALITNLNVEHELITIPGAEHGLRDGDPSIINAAYDSSVEFVNRYMKK